MNLVLDQFSLSGARKSSYDRATDLGVVCPEGIDPWGILDNKEKSMGEKVEALYVCGRCFLLAFFTKHTKGERLQEGFLSLLFFPPSFETLGGLL